ncbi:PIN domain-containing protein [soil metagenome]
MVVENFSSRLIFLDTAPLIYFIEGNSRYQNILSRIFNMNDKGEFTFVTSSVTLLEVLVKPIRDGKVNIAQQYRDVLVNAPGIEILSITPSIAEAAANLRAEYNLRTPDAIQVAAAVEAEANYFLTNDLQLKTLNSIRIITLSELE